MIPSKRLLRSSKLFYVLTFWKNVNKQLTYRQKCDFHILGNLTHFAIKYFDFQYLKWKLENRRFFLGPFQLGATCIWTSRGLFRSWFGPMLEIIEGALWWPVHGNKTGGTWRVLSVENCQINRKSINNCLSFGQFSKSDLRYVVKYGFHWNSHSTHS